MKNLKKYFKRLKSETYITSYKSFKRYKSIRDGVWVGAYRHDTPEEYHSRKNNHLIISIFGIRVDIQIHDRKLREF